MYERPIFMIHFSIARASLRFVSRDEGRADTLGVDSNAEVSHESLFERDALH